MSQMTLVGGAQRPLPHMNNQLFSGTDRGGPDRWDLTPPKWVHLGGILVPKTGSGYVGRIK